jgi:hypothetical protein
LEIIAENNINEVIEIFLLALIENRVDFVNTFLVNRLDISKFLNKKRLCQLFFNGILYFELKSFAKFKNKDPFILFLQKKNKEIKYQDEQNNSQETNEKIQAEQIEMIKFVFEEILKGKNFTFLTSNFDDCYTNPEMYLFYWCILSNRPEIAKAFWILGKVKYFNFFKLKILRSNFNRF